MKKMRYGSNICEVSVADNYSFNSQVPCDYEKETVAYAAKRFLTRSARFCRECTYQSWQLRIEKGKGCKKQDFTYLIPAVLMELPGEWVRICGVIDAVGVTVNQVELLKEHPCFASEDDIKNKIKLPVEDKRSGRNQLRDR